MYIIRIIYKNNIILIKLEKDIIINNLNNILLYIYKIPRGY